MLLFVWMLVWQDQLEVQFIYTSSATVVIYLVFLMFLSIGDNVLGCPIRNVEKWFRVSNRTINQSNGFHLNRLTIVLKKVISCQNVQDNKGTVSSNLNHDEQSC